MKLGRVRGSVVATVRDPNMVGMRLLIVQPIDEERRDKGACVVAADAVEQAGPGDVVYFVASREAAEALSPRFVPVDHAIVGLVDDIEYRK
ncbi:MAG: EutN/CcmL family microcompartment protein [Acidimicrobiia bacterium]